MSIENSRRKPGEDWVAIVQRNGTKEFAAAFAPNAVQWEGKAFGKEVGGTTILTRNEAGLIQTIQLYHRPLQMVMEFSVELGRRLKGKADANLLNS